MNTENQKTKNTWQRKLLSLNWWLCGEVNPTVHPSSPHYPRFWRKDIVIFCLFLPCLTIIGLTEALLNDRSLSFNNSKQYVGVIVTNSYIDPRINFLSRDGVRIDIGMPRIDMLGLPERRKRPSERWRDAIDMVVGGQYACPGRTLLIHAEEWKFTFNPVVRMWSAECFETGKVLLTKEDVEKVYLTSLESWLTYNILTDAVLGAFVVWIVISRERRRYRQYMNSISKKPTQGA